MLLSLTQKFDGDSLSLSWTLNNQGSDSLSTKKEISKSNLDKAIFLPGLAVAVGWCFFPGLFWIIRTDQKDDVVGSKRQSLVLCLKVPGR